MNLRIPTIVLSMLLFSGAASAATYTFWSTFPETEDSYIAYQETTTPDHFYWQLFDCSISSACSNAIVSSLTSSTNCLTGAPDVGCSRFTVDGGHIDSVRWPATNQYHRAGNYLLAFTSKSVVNATIDILHWSIHLERPRNVTHNPVIVNADEDWGFSYIFPVTATHNYYEIYDRTATGSLNVVERVLTGTGSAGDPGCEVVGTILSCKKATITGDGRLGSIVWNHTSSSRTLDREFSVIWQSKNTHNQTIEQQTFFLYTSPNNGTAHNETLVNVNTTGVPCRSNCSFGNITAATNDTYNHTQVLNAIGTNCHPEEPAPGIYCLNGHEGNPLDTELWHYLALVALFAGLSWMSFQGGYALPFGASILSLFAMLELLTHQDWLDNPQYTILIAMLFLFPIAFGAWNMNKTHHNTQTAKA